MISGFEERYIFNTDESEFLFRPMPEKTVTMKRDRSKSGRYSKERLSLLLAEIVMGEKQLPFDICKVSESRCLTKVDINK
jgi:hypothetical protein